MENIRKVNNLVRDKTYKTIRTYILQPFFQAAEIQENVNLNQLYQNCADWYSPNFDTETAKRNIKEQYDPEYSRIYKTAQGIYIESFSGNSDAVLKDIQEILTVLKKEDFLNSPIRQTWLHMISWAKENNYEEALSIYEMKAKETPYNCISFIIDTALCDQKKVIEAYGNYKILFKPVKEKVLEWYSFPESDIDDALQRYFKILFSLETTQEPISVSAIVPEAVSFPLDKVNQNLFRYLEAGTYEMNVEKAGSNDDIKTIITLDFDELEHNRALTFKKLTPFEKRVYVAAGALLEAGNEYVSATQIYKQMGGKGSPADHQIQKIIESCEGMARTRLKVDNQEEAERYNYPAFQRGLFYLFPVESVENVTINGWTAGYCIRFLKDELPLFDLAKQRKQLTRYTPEQWALPFSMTDDHILLDDYFRTRIARMKRDKATKKGSYNGKMLYSTIYENCGIDNKLKRSRAAKKFRTLLDHYIKTGIITDYQEGKDGITITI